MLTLSSTSLNKLKVTLKNVKFVPQPVALARKNYQKNIKVRLMQCFVEQPKGVR
jgi:hypothetical protein